MPAGPVRGQSGTHASPKAVWGFAGIHIVTLAASNYLVQIPLALWGCHTTWGAFSFPAIFLATDLTVRRFGPSVARKVIVISMFPAVILSYLLSVLFLEGSYRGFEGLWAVQVMSARIAVASFGAYLLGQLLDILVFNQLRQLRAWWIAPLTAMVIGSAFDTAFFFSVAFYKSPDSFMANHWIELGLFDYGVKLLVHLLCFLPIYKLLLKRIVAQVHKDALLNQPSGF